jgi:CSLREA domain-containing protein
VSRLRPLLALALCLALLPSAPGHAAPDALSLAVNSAFDFPDATPGDGVCETAAGNGICTLRAAIQEANAHAGADTITLQADTTYLLTRAGHDETALNGDLDITDTVTLLGAGAGSTVLDGNGAVTHDRVLDIRSGVATISGVTVRNGKPFEQIARGGGVLVDTGASLSLMASAVISNTAIGATAAAGGGIQNGGRMTITNSTIAGNSTVSSTVQLGGGLHNLGQLTLIDSTVSGNSTPGDGGGIAAVAGIMTITHSTVSGNFSALSGGEIHNSSATANLFNATVTNNSADSDLNGSGVGGGVANESGATFNFRNSIIAGNYEIQVPGPFVVDGDCSGTISSLGNSLLQGYNSGHCTVNGTFMTAAPKLGPLQDNGGATRTHLPLAGSPAIDAGNSGGCVDTVGAPIATDQRGVGRPQGARCDIGAVEVQVPTNLAFAVQPGGAAPGAPLSPQPAVRALDAFGASVASYTGTVSLAIGANPGGGTLGGVIAMAAVSGTATFSGLSIDRAGGGYTLVASASGLASVTSAPFDIAAPATATPTATPSATPTAAPTGTATPAGVIPRAFLPLLRK